MGYHVAILILAYKRPDDAPVLPVGYVIAPYLLTASWLGAFIAMTIVLSCRDLKEMTLFNFQIAVPQAMRVTQKIQIMLDPLECVILGDIAIRSTIDRRRARRFEKEREPMCSSPRTGIGVQILVSQELVTQTPRYARTLTKIMDNRTGQDSTR
ncbi:unnamed protein product [Cyclocybe aegerita]|uniref:Uncharacterized protein n=1 Tax=Cyclocybe aegerita TaxID=1973307 RepID=A0A8S0VQH8_CYCAE|nr:unnamed protein product [Cyclocybe aegerita]